MGLELVPPHFSSSYWVDSILRELRAKGGYAVAEGVYAINEGRLKLLCVAKVVS